MENASQAPRLSRRALLIIDMQLGMFNGPDKPFQGAQVLENINQLIAKARGAQAPIFAVRHTGPQGSPIAPGSALSQLLPALEIDAIRDVVFDKTRPNCFIDTELAKWLADEKVETRSRLSRCSSYWLTNWRLAADGYIRSPSQFLAWHADCKREHVRRIAKSEHIRADKVVGSKTRSFTYGFNTAFCKRKRSDIRLATRACSTGKKNW